MGLLSRVYGCVHSLLLVSIFAGIPFVPAIGQIENYGYRTIGIGEGLSHTGVLAITQDSSGFIWFGGFNGLNKYDGYDIQSFSNEKAISPERLNRIHDIAVENNVLWLATEGGASRFNLETEQFITVAISEVSHENTEGNNLFFKRVIVDKSGNKWFAADTFLAVLADESAGKSIILPVSGFQAVTNYTQARKINNIVEGPFGNIWVATTDGIFQLRNIDGQIRLINGHYVSGGGALGNFIEDIYVLPDKKLFFCLGNNMYVLALFETDGGEVFVTEAWNRELPAIIQNNGSVFKVNAAGKIVSEANGTIWFVSQGRIVKMKFQNEDLQLSLVNSGGAVSEKYEFLSTDFPSLFIDRTGCMFIGSYEDGVLVMDLFQKPFHFIDAKAIGSREVFPNRTISAIYKGVGNELWLGTGKGLVRCNLQNGAVENMSDKIAGMPRDYIRSIHPDKNGNFWIAGYGGLSYYNTRTGEVVKSEVFAPGLATLANDSWALASDSFGRIWCGTHNNGILVLTPSANGKYTFEHVHSNGTMKLVSDEIHYLLSDTNANQMFVTTDKGFDRIVLDSVGAIRNIIHYNQSARTNRPISSEQVFPIVHFNDSVLFIGTLKGGLNRVTMQQGFDTNFNGFYYAEVYALHEGLPFDDIEGLLMDCQNRIWLSGKGLVCFDDSTKRIASYNRADGIKMDAFKINSSASSADSVLFFGGVNGVTYFNPSAIQPNAIEPKVAIVKLIVNNQEVHTGVAYDGQVILPISMSFVDKINLNYRQNDIRVKFSSLHYASPANNVYRYKLHGHDNNWQFTQPEMPYASWSNLSYKKYTLEVWGSNNDDLWSTSPTLLTLVIKPPFWLSKVAYLVYALLFVSVLTVIFIYQRNYLTVRNNLSLLQLEEKKKEELLNAKLQFFTNVSHEFRTPLTFIIAPLQDIKSKVQIPEIRQSLNLALKYAQRMLNLVDQLIQFRKTESGLEKINSVYVDVNELLKAIVASFSEPARNKGIELIYTPSERNLKVWADVSKLETIVYNLLSNAFQALEEKRVVEVALLDQKAYFEMVDATPDYFRYVAGDESTAQVDYAILVSDTGRGISEQAVLQIFERFFSGHHSGLKGAGIGLALVKNLVTLIGGQVFIHSQLNRGTKFLVTLSSLTSIEKYPLSQIDEQEPQPTDVRSHSLLQDADISLFGQFNLDNQKSSSTFFSVLLVEDNIELSNYLATQLGQKYRVEVVPNGKEALRKVVASPPDIIISDVMMPFMDGFELCKAIKSNIATKNIPVILLTAKSDKEDRLKGLSVGADDYIVKPFSIEYLNLKIYNLVKVGEEKKFLVASHFSPSQFESRITISDRDFILNVRQIVEKYMTEEYFTVDFVKRELGYSRSRFIQRIKKLTGQTPSNFVRDIRMKLAVDHLLRTGGQINEAAGYIGMNPSNFTREFRRVYGVTPSEYLQNLG